MGHAAAAAKLRRAPGRSERDQNGAREMSTETIIAVLGIVGGFCTTFAFVPQVIKIWKQGGRDLSYGMLALYLFGVLLWLAYGMLLHAPAIVWTNAATALLIAFATISKAWTDRREIAKDALPAQVPERG